jgi:hypothetical protein
MAPREARKVALLRKSDALNSAAKIFGLKVGAFVLYGIFLSLDLNKEKKIVISTFLRHNRG